MNKKHKNPVYLDHNATTRLDPEAAKAMKPYLEENFGNPSSQYSLGIKAKQGIENARKEVAGLIGAHYEEVFFTSGGSESNNMVIKGVIDFKNPEKNHIITSRIEHPAILNPALFLMELGVKVSFLPVDGSGRVDPDDVRKAVLPETVLISVMLANNETGTIQPIREISGIARENGISMHTDAAQAVGKIKVDVNELDVDFLSIAGHKFYGPKGIGALFIRSGQVITPLIHGAAQEGGRRAGTENTMLAAGLGAASTTAKARLEDDIENIKALRNHFQALLFEGIDGLVLNGHPDERLPNTLNVSVPGLEGGRILEGLDFIMASTGAACHDTSIRLSHVLAAMAVPPEIGMGALRFSLGRSNTRKEIEEAAQLIINKVKRMKNE
ncbi:MAG TPA: cysteine desulfurase [Desulfobacteraceae bacterium]|nr:cysteine desulfurase [Desulfobacteraceae bacterium]